MGEPMEPMREPGPTTFEAFGRGLIPHEHSNQGRQVIALPIHRATNNSATARLPPSAACR